MRALLSERKERRGDSSSATARGSDAAMGQKSRNPSGFRANYRNAFVPAGSSYPLDTSSPWRLGLVIIGYNRGRRNFEIGSRKYNENPRMGRGFSSDFFLVETRPLSWSLPSLLLGDRFLSARLELFYPSRRIEQFFLTRIERMTLRADFNADLRLRRTRDERIAAGADDLRPGKYFGWMSFFMGVMITPFFIFVKIGYKDIVFGPGMALPIPTLAVSSGLVWLRHTDPRSFLRPGMASPYRPSSSSGLVWLSHTNPRCFLRARTALPYRPSQFPSGPVWLRHTTLARRK